MIKLVTLPRIVSLLSCLLPRAAQFHKRPSVGKVVVDLVHFQDNVVGNSGLSKQNIELARHTSSNWMNTESHVFAFLLQNAHLK